MDATPSINETVIPSLLAKLDIKVAKCYHYIMSQPVKLSDALVLDARLTAELAERSIAGQIEYWARLGRAVEPLLRGDKSLALRKSGDEVPLSELLNSVDLPAGRKRVKDYLESQPYPHFEPAHQKPGYLVRIEKDGTSTVGRFVNRQFVPLKPNRKSSTTAKNSVEAPANKTTRAAGKRKR